MMTSSQSNGSKNNKKLWNQMKEQGRKVQLQGEIQWIKRQIVARQKKWGVEFFDQVTNEKQTLLGVSAGTLFDKDAAETLVWKGPLEQLREQLRESKEKHQRLEAKCLSLLNSLNHYDNNNNHNSQDGPGRALDKIKIAAQRKQLQAQLLVLEQQMKRKKESFGVQVFCGLERCKDLSKLNLQEQKVQECIDVALADVHQLQAQINAKYSQVHSLHEGETEGLMVR
jgi:hypothetical protein